MPNPADRTRVDDPHQTPRLLRRHRTEEAATTHPTDTKHAERPRPMRRLDPSRLPTRLRWAQRTNRPPLAALRWLAIAVPLAAGLVLVSGSPAFAAGGGAPTLNGVIANLTNWIVGILAGVATLFLTIGGLRYLTAGGDPGQVEKAKTALKSAAIGYALAILAPLLVSILASVVGRG